MGNVRWNISVSAETDQALRVFLANHRDGRKGDLSRFIEEAVRSHLFRQTVEELKAGNTDLEESELNNFIDEALDWARG